MHIIFVNLGLTGLLKLLHFLPHYHRTLDNLFFLCSVFFLTKELKCYIPFQMIIFSEYSKHKQTAHSLTILSRLTFSSTIFCCHFLNIIWLVPYVYVCISIYICTIYLLICSWQNIKCWGWLHTLWHEIHFRRRWNCALMACRNLLSKPPVQFNYRALLISDFLMRKPL